MPVELDYWAQNLKKIYTERDQKKEIVLYSVDRKAIPQKNNHNPFSIFETD